ALDVKNTWTMNVEFYTGVDERLDLPMILPPAPEPVDPQTARMLIADDVADTGETLRLVKDFCAGKVGEVRCAVLYEKSRSLVACEYVWKRTDLWIDFPWSADAPVAKVTVPGVLPLRVRPRFLLLWPQSGEEDHVADRLASAQEHREPVDPEPEAARRRHAVGERLDVVRVAADPDSGPQLLVEPCL